jgi:hypothetical protein
MLPCQVIYHTACIRVGEPFRTRRREGAGLVFPPVTDWPNFVCELCTVRACLDRELHGRFDWHLLCYERMRMIDTANRWTLGTHKQYQGKMRIIRAFEGDYGVQIAKATPLLRPPSTTAIPMMWAELRYSLQSTNRKLTGEEDPRIVFGSLRQLRSAKSQHDTIDMLMAYPGRLVYQAATRQVAVFDLCRPTDELSNSLFSAGLSARIGAETRPSFPVLDRHVRALDKALQARFTKATTHAAKVETCKAALANLTFWLAWLRSMECFLLRWADVHVTRPQDGPREGLPPGLGAVVLDLTPETKTSRSMKKDVVIAYETLSRLKWGEWFLRYKALMHGRAGWEQDTRYLFCFENGTPWTSAYFRLTYVIPQLYKMKTDGDPYLSKFDDIPGNRIEDWVHSMHSYRHGARESVGAKQPNTRRKATNDEVYEHGRWRRKRGNEPIDKQYDRWPLVRRLNLTLFCQ